MNVTMRLKFDMARRVRDFCRTHPNPNPGYTAAVVRLDDRLVRAEALAEQEVTGRLAVAGAIANKDTLRQEIQQTVALLAALAEPAAQEEPEIRAVIVRPSVQLSHQSFLTRCRVAANTGSAHQELLTRYGMPENFLTDLNAALDRFEQALNVKNAGRAAHVGARAELQAVMAEIMLLVRQLDALNRYHFRKDAESLAAWKSARDVAWPLPEKVESGPEQSDQPAA